MLQDTRRIHRASGKQTPLLRPRARPGLRCVGRGLPEVDRLIGMLAHVGSRRHWCSMQARSADEAQGALAWMLRRRWALTALRENARLKLERLEFVGRRGCSSSSPKAERGSRQRSARQEGGVRVPPRSACGFAPLSANARMMRIPDALTAH